MERIAALSEQGSGEKALKKLSEDPEAKSLKRLEALIRSIPFNKLVTEDILFIELSEVSGSNELCYKTFYKLLLKIAQQSNKEGKAGAPYWRVLKKYGFLNHDYPYGGIAQRIRLEMEGHRINQRGRKLNIESFFDHIAGLHS